MRSWVFVLIAAIALAVSSDVGDDHSQSRSAQDEAAPLLSPDDKRQLRRDSEKARLLFCVQAHRAQHDLGWTPASTFAEPVPADGALSTLTRVRAAMTALFATGSSASKLLDARLEQLWFDCGVVRETLRRQAVADTFDQACAAAFPALFQADPDGVADRLLTSMVTFLAGMVPAPSPPRPLPPPSRTLPLEVRKRLRSAGAMLLDDREARVRETNTASSSELWPMMTAALILLADRPAAAPYNADACAALTAALAGLRLTPFAHDWTLMIPPRLQVDIAARYLRRHRALGAAVAAFPLPGAVLTQLVLLQGVHADLQVRAESFSALLLEEIVERYLGRTPSVPIALRPYLVAVLMERVAERRRRCVQEAQVWCQGRRRVRDALAFVQILIEIASQLLVDCQVAQVDLHAIAMHDDDVPMEPPARVGLLDCLKAIATGASLDLGPEVEAPFTFGMIATWLAWPCPSLLIVDGDERGLSPA